MISITSWNILVTSFNILLNALLRASPSPLNASSILSTASLNPSNLLYAATKATPNATTAAITAATGFAIRTAHNADAAPLAIPITEPTDLNTDTTLVITLITLVAPINASIPATTPLITGVRGFSISRNPFNTLDINCKALAAAAINVCPAQEFINAVIEFIMSPAIVEAKSINIATISPILLTNSCPPLSINVPKDSPSILTKPVIESMKYLKPSRAPLDISFLAGSIWSNNAAID